MVFKNEILKNKIFENEILKNEIFEILKWVLKTEYCFVYLSTYLKVLTYLNNVTTLWILQELKLKKNNLFESRWIILKTKQEKKKIHKFILSHSKFMHTKFLRIFHQIWIKFVRLIYVDLMPNIRFKFE